MTWEADVDTLATVVEEAGAAGGCRPHLALTLEPAWLDSRATLRRMIGAARQAVAGLTAAVLRGPRPLALHAVLAEEGIRAVLVEAGVDAGRGSRRPAPTGWRCHNPVWGLWEVQMDPRRKSGLAAWLPGGGMPRPRPGGLHALHAGDVSPTHPLGGRLDRWLAWALRREAGGRLRVAGLGEVPGIIARRGQPPVSGSVLKAA